MKKLYLLLLLATVFVACKKDMDVEFSTFEVEDEKFIPSYTSTELSCKVRCAATINQFYLQYDTVADFATYQEVELVENEKTEVYSVKIGELLDNTTYYVRYVAVNSYSQVTSEEVSEFKTLQATAPTIEVREITDVLDTIATVSFVLKFNGGADVTKMGVCWSVDSVPIINGEHIECSSDVVNSVSDGDSLVLKISGLEENMTYYVRAYAENKMGVGYSESKAFITLALPEVETEDVTDIQLTSASLSGLVLFNGNDTTIEYGFCWGEEDELTIENSQNVKVEGAEDSTFTYRLSNLKDETKYYVRAYAKNKIGLVYGNVKEFTTQSTILAEVVTSSVTEIEYTSAIVSGSVMSDGGAEIIERGVCYSKTQNPTILDNKVISGKGKGYFLATLSNLDDGAKYYVRAYAKNKKGVSYGKNILFETKAYLLADVITSVPTDIAYTSAKVGGKVEADGGSNVTERGICYSTTKSPTIENKKVVLGTGLGSFTTELFDLQDGTKYYVRAYAKNKKGVSYGETMEFETKAYSLAEVITSSPIEITYTSAIVGGTVVSDGGVEVVERGVCYSTLGNPTIVDSKVIVGKGMGSFTITLSDLQVGTKYYMRAYAINSVGIAYGEIVVFTTLDYIEAGHRYVDLGLSVKWATCNVGAERPEDYGDYFAWGEVEPKAQYDWSTYKYSYDDISYDELTKYCTNSSYGHNNFVDNKTQLDPMDDAATINWGGSWRMPTFSEIEELRNNCTWTWITQNGVEGYKVTGKNGNSIFLPAAGFMRYGVLNSVGEFGLYFSSLLYDTPEYSYCMLLGVDDVDCKRKSYRIFGLSIRPVCK